MQTTLYDVYAAAALAGMTVNTNGIDYIEGVAERASSIAIEMLELRRSRADKLRRFGIIVESYEEQMDRETRDRDARLVEQMRREALEDEYLDGLAVDRR